MDPEPSEELDRYANAVIGAAIEVHQTLGPGYLEKTYEEALAIEVHQTLGPGYLEKTYEEALAIEFALRGIPFSRQHPIALTYKGHVIGEGRLDFLVGNQLVVELKTVDSLGDIHKAQVISYLKATGHMLGLLINFHVPVLKVGIKRIIHSAN